jgi:3-dehydroquinate synthase
MPSVIPVQLPQNSYNITIAPGGLEQLGTEMQALQSGKKVLVVSNPGIFRHYGERVIAVLERAGFVVQSCILPAGERYKTPATLQKIYDAALDFRVERSSTFVALGGGVIGDMTGFAAATWLRGVNVVQVPTSLLAMVDAAIGGKTGVNHPRGKNLIGAFHQPRLVLIDSQVLKTLPAREFRAAIAEVIKYGVIWDAELFTQLEHAPRIDRLSAISEDLLEEILVRSCQAKAHVVSKDEKEAGLRAILNYGHTIGHAVGMIAAGQLAADLHIWSDTLAQRQLALVQKAGLPTQIPATLEIEAIVEALQVDKKVSAGRVRFVLPTQLGAATVTDQVPTDAIQRVLKQMQGPMS